MAWLLESRLLRSARPFVPSGLPPADDAAGEDDRAMAQMMCDLVMGEIQAEISRVEREAEQRRQEELRLTNQPDYTWLIDWRLRAKRPLGFKESTEIELLCAKVRPSEWRRLLGEWRTRVRFVDARDEVLHTFRKAVDQLIAERMQRECTLHSVDEHGSEVQQQVPSAAKCKSQQRPKTARSPRAPFTTTPLSAFTLMGRLEEDNV